MISSRALSDLDPTARDVCNAQLAECHHQGIELIVTSTWRDFEAQTALYAIGRTLQTKRLPVTNAKAGRSWHQYKCAWDVVPIVAGKPVWDPKDTIWKEVVRIGKAVGAQAGAEWKTFPDLPHFQFVPEAITLDIAQDRFLENGTIFV